MACRPDDLQDLAYGFLDPESESRVRDHAAACGRCAADLGRLEGEKRVLSRAAAQGAAPARERRPLVPLAFAAALLLGLLWLLSPDPAGSPVVLVPGAQEKGSDRKGAREIPDTEEALRSEIDRLQSALGKTTDEQERYRIRTTLGDLERRLDRLALQKDDKTAMKEKPPADGKKPPVKGKGESDDERRMKLEAETREIAEKLKMSPEPGEKKRLEARLREIEREMKTVSPVRTPVNLKEVEMRLQSNPDDVPALVDRATAMLEAGKAEQAMKDCDRAIALKSDFAPAWLKRAIAQAMLGHMTEAWADAKRGEELDRTAGRMIDDTLRMIKRLTAAQAAGKERKPTAADLGSQVAGLRDRLNELQEMSKNADLVPADRDRARRDADRVEAEITRLTAEMLSLPAEPEQKPVKKK